jgi:hypothetical protein
LTKLLVHPVLLRSIQKDIKRRYRGYKKGGQQGLGMVWRNTMASLKATHEDALKEMKNKA